MPKNSAGPTPEVTFKALDAAGNRPAITRALFKQAFGQGLMKMGRMKKVAQTDLPLTGFADVIANIASGDKFRKPEAPPPSR